MRRFSDTSDGLFISETTDGPYCLFDEAHAEIERLRAVVSRAKDVIAYYTREPTCCDSIILASAIDQLGKAIKDWY